MDYKGNIVEVEAGRFQVPRLLLPPTAAAAAAARQGCRQHLPGAAPCCTALHWQSARRIQSSDPATMQVCYDYDKDELEREHEHEYYMYEVRAATSVPVSERG
jgi:hypothetical protein